MKATGVVVMTQFAITFPLLFWDPGKAYTVVLNGGHAAYNIPFYAK